MRRRRLLYLDASAVVKLVVDEPESPRLRQVVERDRLAASELVLAEAPRAVARVGADGSRQEALRSELERVLGGFDLVPVTRPLLVAAGTLGPPLLRTLDAVHLASALSLGAILEAFVGYDRRQLAAASNSGLAVVSPGVGAANLGGTPPP